MQVFYLNRLIFQKSDSKLEFFDVKHQIALIYLASFFTKDFIKTIATNRCTTNGNFFHLPYVFKSIIFNEQRHHKNDQIYKRSLNRLKKMSKIKF